MRTLLLLALLLPTARAELTFSSHEDARMNCTATGKWDSYYKHYAHSCEKIGPVTCTRAPEATQWKCTFEEIDGYVANMQVGDDHNSVHITMSPTMNIHPILYLVFQITVTLMCLLMIMDHPRSILGVFAGNMAYSYTDRTCTVTA